MAQGFVSPERFEAGQVYLDALDRLGFIADGAMWSMREGEPDTLELSVFSDFVDRVGTKRMFDALFAAHENARTPPEFDPWIVGLYSPNQMFFEAIAGFDFGAVPAGTGAGFEMSGGVDIDEDARVLRFTEFKIVRLVHPRWVYRPLARRRVNGNDTLRHWQRFERAVAKAA